MKHNLHLSNYEYTKLLDDIKLISRSIKIIIEEKQYDKRKYAGILTEDLMTRLFRDIQEMHKHISSKSEFNGKVNEI